MLYSLHSSKPLKHPVVFAQPCVTLTSSISTHWSCTQTTNPPFPLSTLKIPQFHSPHPENTKHQIFDIIKMLLLKQQKSWLRFFHSPTHLGENNPIAVTLHIWHLSIKTTNAVLLHYHQVNKHHMLSTLLPHRSSFMLLPAAAERYCAERSQVGLSQIPVSIHHCSVIRASCRFPCCWVVCLAGLCALVNL